MWCDSPFDRAPCGRIITLFLFKFNLLFIHHSQLSTIIKCQETNSKNRTNSRNRTRSKKSKNTKNKVQIKKIPWQQRQAVVAPLPILHHNATTRTLTLPSGRAMSSEVSSAHPQSEVISCRHQVAYRHYPTAHLHSPATIPTTVHQERMVQTQ